MNNLYLIGGRSRAGKSTIARGLAQRQSLGVEIKTDYIRAAIRHVLVGEVPRKDINRVTFCGIATYQETDRPKNEGTVPIGRIDQGEDDLAWLGVLGLLLQIYDGKGVDVLVEGVAITPERVYELQPKLKKLQIKNPAFIGYSNGPEEPKHTEELKKQAEQFGYGYFDRKDRALEQHVQAVVDFLIQTK